MTLTAEQLSVVNLVSGRHLVLAPPGSGKTEMLSQRILRALASGVDPRRMLCATFTNRAAFEMRDRVLGAAGADCALPDVEQSIFSFLGASASSFATAVAGCERHYFKTNFRATPLLLEILMRYSLEALRSDWEFLPAPSDVMRTNGEVMLSPDDSPKAVLETVRHLIGDNVAENVAILVRTNREADDCERLVRGLGYRTVKVSGRDLFAYPTMRMRKRFGRSS